MDLIDERNNCLNCKNKPCSQGCPLGNNIPAMIHENEYQKAFEILSQTTVLPAICGRVCPHSRQCEGNCVRGIKGKAVSIGKIEADVGDKSIEDNYNIPELDIREFLNIDNNDIEINKAMANLENKRVAIVGGGPAGLTAAAFLARCGVKVTIFDKHEKLGGILQYGIPDFRLPKTVVQNTVNKICKLGNIEVKCNAKLGEDVEIEELEKNFDVILLAFGANISSKMNIEGENLQGVYGANETLENNNSINLTGKRVAVIGGGNVAMDMARTALRNGAKEVKIIYRRSEEQMPADKREIEISKEEGIEFLFLNNIVRILSKKDNKDNIVEKIECIKTQLVKKEGDNRLSPVNIEGSNYFIDVDIVFMAIGSGVDEEVVNKINVSLSKYKNVEVDVNYQTSNKKIFACGDLVGQKATVAWAANGGKKAAQSIMKCFLYE